MASLSFGEKRILEAFLQMGGGYVLDFSNRTFQEFIFDSIGLDIDDAQIGGLGSKASRLRHLWSRQADHLVGKLLNDLVAYNGALRATELGQKCRLVADRLLQSAPVKDAEVISALSQREEFERLAKSILDSISRNDPESGLDRLHTFGIKFMRSLCERHGIAVEREKPLHSLFGEYVKKLKELGLIESPMTERILKSSISIFDAYNDVRNNRSLAHDNQLLNRNESLLILNHVTTTIRFIWALENSIQDIRSAPAAIQPETDAIPF